MNLEQELTDCDGEDDIYDDVWLQDDNIFDEYDECDAAILDEEYDEDMPSNWEAETFNYNKVSIQIDDIEGEMLKGLKKETTIIIRNIKDKMKNMLNSQCIERFHLTPENFFNVFFDKEVFN